MVVFAPIEELYFAKTKSNSRYALAHTTFDGKSLHPMESQYFENLSYDNLCWYLHGASFGKNNKKLHLYNGISSNTRDSFFPNQRFYNLKERELEKLLLDTSLREDFEGKIKTIK